MDHVVERVAWALMAVKPPAGFTFWWDHEYGKHVSCSVMHGEDSLATVSFTYSEAYPGVEPARLAVNSAGYSDDCNYFETRLRATETAQRLIQAADTVFCGPSLPSEVVELRQAVEAAQSATEAAERAVDAYFMPRIRFCLDAKDFDGAEALWRQMPDCVTRVFVIDAIRQARRN